jgi:phosphoglycerate dehydrogenase-like enzyme
MKLLLNTSYQFTDSDQQYLQSVWPGIELLEQFNSLEQLNGSEVTILITEQVPRDLFHWPDLRWVQLLSAGANQLLNHPILETDIQITTASGTHGVPIAQYITCTWLMMVHHMQQIMEFKPSRNWPNRESLAGFPFRGLTAGIIGYGSIGRESARQLKGLGMKIICLKRDSQSRADTGYNAWPDTGDPDGKIPSAWFGPEQIREMLPQCDLVVVTVPSTPQTKGMISKPEFSLMKKSARMIIISRGGIVSEQALADALNEGQLAEAVVDCFVQEPIPSDHFFFDVPNLIMTPHMSGVYEGFWPVIVGLIGENLKRFKAGLPLLNQTNRQQGY